MKLTKQIFSVLKKLLDIRPDIVQKVLVSIGGPTDLASKSNFALVSLIQKKKYMKLFNKKYSYYRFPLKKNYGESLFKIVLHYVRNTI